MSLVSNNLLGLYSEKENNDCSSIMSLGATILQLLRKMREILDFYNMSQQGSESQIKFKDELYDIYVKMHKQTANCLSQGKIRKNCEPLYRFHD